MATAVTPNVTVPFEPILCLALETGAMEWKIAFSSLGSRTHSGGSGLLA